MRYGLSSKGTQTADEFDSAFPVNSHPPVLPGIVRRFNHTNPNVTLEVSSDLSVNLLRDISQDQYDLILRIALRRNRANRRDDDVGQTRVGGQFSLDHVGQ